MLHALRHGVAKGWKHFFYGTTPETLEKLTSEVKRRVPGVLVVGSESPPFREITERELEEAAARIRAADTDILWLGLGMPKQELLMRRVRERLPGVALLGVGAAFDFVAGNVPQAPRWLQNLGGEWAFRLAQEPRRLWRRYAWNNPAYLGLLGYEWVRKARRR
jgi:N-acetylglucosaminyldiphosphoundecaprenol N-acetyl-beta-D-mannosaminyltransferase